MHQKYYLGFSYDDGVALAQLFREFPLSLLNGTVSVSCVLHLVRKSL